MSIVIGLVVCLVVYVTLMAMFRIVVLSLLLVLGVLRTVTMFLAWCFDGEFPRRQTG